MIGAFVSVVKGVCLSEERRVKSEKSKCKRSACFHIFLTLVVIVVKVVIGVRVNSKRSAYLSEKIRVKSRRKAQLKMKN